MEQYLLELIKSNNRVIVPNFGAFIVSRDAGTTVLFNNFLSFNDGLLINHISSQKGIETTEATQQVSDFVDKVKKELDEKGEYTIEKLGRFTKDQNGILRFTQDSHLADMLPDEPLDEKTGNKSDDSKLLDIDSGAADETIPTEDKKEKKAEKSKSASDSKKDGKLLNLDEKTSEPVKKQPAKKEPVKPSASPKPPVASPTGAGARASASGPYEEKRNGLPAWAIAFIILIPIILILLYLFFWRDSDKTDSEKVTKKEVVDTVASRPVVDSAAIRKAQEEEERLRKEQVAREKAEAEKANVRRHHIIVGSFREETNAQKLVTSLKEKGFENAVTFVHNNQHVVSADSFESLSKARDAQENFLQQQRMENWIITKK